MPTYRLEILEPTLAGGLWYRRSFEAANDEAAKANAWALFEEYALDAKYGYVLCQDKRVVIKRLGSPGSNLH